MRHTSKARSVCYSASSSLPRTWAVFMRHYLWPMAYNPVAPTPKARAHRGTAYRPWDLNELANGGEFVEGHLELGALVAEAELRGPLRRARREAPLVHLARRPHLRPQGGQHNSKRAEGRVRRPRLLDAVFRRKGQALLRRTMRQARPAPAPRSRGRRARGGSCRTTRRAVPPPPPP